MPVIFCAALTSGSKLNNWGHSLTDILATPCSTLLSPEMSESEDNPLIDKFPPIVVNLAVLLISCSDGIEDKEQFPPIVCKDENAPNVLKPEILMLPLMVSRLLKPFKVAVFSPPITMSPLTEFNLLKPSISEKSDCIKMEPPTLDKFSNESNSPSPAVMYIPSFATFCTKKSLSAA